MLLLAMARPKAFDRDKALLAAIEVFAERGFEGASTEALLKAMGLNRQSLYDTYGSKRQLYLEALGRYNQDSTTMILAEIASGETPFDGLKGALLGFVDRAVERTHPACLGVSAISEFGGRDPEISAVSEVSYTFLSQAIKAAIKDAQVAGEVRRGLDVEQASDFLLSMFSGLKVSARSGASEVRLRQMAELALQALV